MEIFENGKVENNFSSRKLGFALIGIVGATAVGICALTVPFISPALRKICVPYVPATTTQVENAMKCLGRKKGTVIDLGSGDGRLVIAAAKRGFKAEGVELNFWLILYSRLLSWRAGTHHMTTFTRRNLFHVDFKYYDNVIIFGTQELMQNLDQKLIENDYKGLVVACRFPFINRSPSLTVGVGIDTVWAYHFDKCNG